MTTYFCLWCAWEGTEIHQQLNSDGRYSCHLCGNVVEPGPHLKLKPFWKTGK